MPKPTVYLLDKIHPQATKHAQSLFHLILPDSPEALNWRQSASAIIIRGRRITAADLAASPNLTLIAKHGVGLDKIDTAACAARGITVLNTPGANARAVAELVLGLTLAVARGLRSIITRQRTETVGKESCLGLTLYGKTIGIIGTGDIGRTVAEMFSRAFDTKILVYHPRKNRADLPAWTHITYELTNKLDDLLARSDVLTIHVPLTEETRGLLGEAQLRRMKPDAILINTARGGIVDEDELARVLSEGHLWGAGLDCHEQEPPTQERYARLWENLNVISTPHVGASTDSAMLAVGMAVVNGLQEYLRKQGLE